MRQTSWCCDGPLCHVSQPQVIKVSNTVYAIQLTDSAPHTTKNGSSRVEFLLLVHHWRR